MKTTIYKILALFLLTGTAFLNLHSQNNIVSFADGTSSSTAAFNIDPLRIDIIDMSIDVTETTKFITKRTRTGILLESQILIQRYRENFLCCKTTRTRSILRQISDMKFQGIVL